MQKILKGTDIAGYRLVEQIGVGSAGEVWRATNGKTSVAVKFLNESLLTSPNRTTHIHRFRNEAHALKTVSDLPHVPTHIHHELEIERPYIVMQFVESPAYSTLMAAGEMLYIPLLQRLAALKYLAETLNLIHQQGIIHRDIKPGNMHGIEYPFLLDFSIGLPLEEVSESDRHIGTPLYLTPDLLPPSPRTDNYAFAIVTYEILFGRHPIFDYRNIPNNAESLRQQAGEAILNETWYRPIDLDKSALPVNLQGADLEALTQIFQNALMLSDDRYINAQAFLDDVIESIHVASNVDYLNQVPVPTGDVNAGQFNEVEHFTDHLVQVYSANTDLPVAGGTMMISERQWLLGLSALFILIFVVVLFVALAPSG